MRHRLFCSVALLFVVFVVLSAAIPMVPCSFNVADGVRFRYEDTTLVEGQTMSAGLTLKSFVVTTTDEAFKPQYVDRTKETKRHVKVRGGSLG